MAEPFGFGIEEEYFLVDAETKSVARGMPEAFFKAAKCALGDRITGEFLQSQIEVLTAPHRAMAEARTELEELRRSVASIAATHGLAILAAGTHPTAFWGRSRQTEGERYDAVMDDLQMIGRRNMLCGLHVHVELPDPNRRVDVMMRMLPYLPLFIALSTSSPFWQARRTGLKGYRLAAYDELPRTGLPELLRTQDDFDAYVAALVRARIIKDSSYIWWAIRPSHNHPTLELRAPDCCTRLPDSIAIAALYRALAHKLFHDPSLHANIDAIERAIIVENKWRAQRYGIEGTFADGRGNGAIPVSTMLDQVLGSIATDADALDCRAEAEQCREIIARGTSADAQLAIYAKHEAEGNDFALRVVTEWLAKETMR
ncbi:MAG: carboxylate-amine ligase [Rhizobiales bacterium]|nr:carboxylate-amine ligase [Hyphomicrobiales bacterium]